MDLLSKTKLRTPKISGSYLPKWEVTSESQYMPDLCRNEEMGYALKEEILSTEKFKTTTYRVSVPFNMGPDFASGHARVQTERGKGR